jgi:hypothetical protein
MGCNTLQPGETPTSRSRSRRQDELTAHRRYSYIRHLSTPASLGSCRSQHWLSRRPLTDNGSSFQVSTDLQPYQTGSFTPGSLSLPPASARFLLGLLTDPEDGGDMSLRMSDLPLNYAVLQRERPCSSNKKQNLRIVCYLTPVGSLTGNDQICNVTVPAQAFIMIPSTVMPVLTGHVGIY